VKTLLDLLDGALQSAGLETARDLWDVRRVWDDAVGARIAAQATPVALARDELTVSVVDSVWRQELAFLAPEIVAGVNRKVGRELVRRVRLIGQSTLVESGPARSAPPKPRR